MEHLFSGLKVIDCATVIAAPVAAMMLGDYGADVIKIEAPGEGDMLRMLSHVAGTPEAGNEWFWQMDGRNKRGLVLDLKQAKGQEVLRRLVAECDVFITNQPSRGARVARAKVRRPRASKRTNDLCVADRLWRTGSRTCAQGLRPARVLGPKRAHGSDAGTRNSTHPGPGRAWATTPPVSPCMPASSRRSCTANARAKAAWCTRRYSPMVFGLRQVSPGRRRRRGRHATLSRSLPTSPGSRCAPTKLKTIAGCSSTWCATNRCSPSCWPPWRRPSSWQIRASKALEDLWAHRHELGEELQSIFLTKTSDEWLAVFADYEVPVNRVALVEELVADEQVRANEIAVELAAEVGVPRMIRHPLNISSVASVGPTRAPAIGEHTEEILQGLGYSEEEIREIVGS